MILTGALFLSTPAYADMNITANHTLAPPLAVHPPCRIVNGIRTVFEMKPGELHRERKEVFEDALKADKIHSILKDLFRTGLAYQVSMYNAFDAIIDKMEEFGFKGYKGEIISEFYLDDEEIVIKITDNGKTIEFESEGKPKIRERDIGKQFGGHGRGVPFIKAYVWSREGTLKWHQLKNGTRIEIRLPRKCLPCEIEIDEDDRIVIEDKEETSVWDGETVRSVKAGETPGESFRNRWAFVDIGFLMAQALKLQISKHTLISLVKEHIENKDGTGEIILEGYDVEGIEEIRDGDQITAFSLPIMRDNKPAYKLVYSLAEAEASAAVIPLGEGTNVYVKAEPAVKGLKGSVLKETRPIEGIDLWEDPDIAEELAEMENSLAKSERRYFRPVDESKVSDVIKKAKDYAGVYEPEKEETDLQLIKKTINNIDDVKAFLRNKGPWCCLTFFAKEDIIFNYELNLEPLGYISLKQATEKHITDITEEMRVSIRKAVSESLRQGDDVFTHGHLHDGNIMLKFDDNGKLMDIKMVDWKYLERTEIPEEVRELFSGKKDNLYRASLIQKHLEGYDFEGIYSLEADFSYSNMAWVNLRKAVLTGAILEGAFLFGADLRYTDLRDSDLSKADLVKAVLNGADLRGTTLWNADLRDADLSDADLRGADLLNTDLKGTILINSDLRGADFDLPEFKDAVLRNTKFNRDQGHVFKAQGFHVVYKDQWCEVTSPDAGLKGIDLGEDREVIGIADEFKEMVEEIRKNGIKNFDETPYKEISPRIKFGDRFSGLYQYAEGEQGLQVIRRSPRHNFDTLKEFFETEKPRFCPTFFEQGNDRYTFELNLAPLGYATLTDITNNFAKNFTEEMRESIREAVSKSLRQGKKWFVHTHLHARNILVKFNDTGNLIDVKIIDSKYIREARQPKDLKDYIEGKREDLVKAVLKRCGLEGYDFEGINMKEAVLRDSFLDWANFRDADLENAQMISTQLIGADLTGANLRDADLGGAYLTGANLRFADLRGVELTGHFIQFDELGHKVGIITRHANFNSAVMEDTKFDKDKGKDFEKKGYYVVYKKDYCLVTSPELVKPESVKPDKESEEIHVQRFSDNFKLIQAKEDKKISFIALGTSWIKGYKKGRYLQYDDLNRLIISIRQFCEEMGIEFIDGDDRTVAARVCVIKKDSPEARGIVLAGEDIIEFIYSYLKESGLEHDENVLLAGVNNRRLTTDSYMRLMEMLALTLKLYRTRTIDEKAVKDLHPRLGFQLKSKRRIIFEPDAEPMDYESLKHLYKVQIFA